MWISKDTDFGEFELDELFWFTNGRKEHEYGINTFIMTMISRIPRQILAFDVDNSIKATLIQQMINSVPPAKKYYSDGCMVYLDVDFLGRHKRNAENKNDTHIIEGTNCDLRHHISGLHRKSRCFFRSMETLKTVLSVFIDAYNKFGEAKQKHRIPINHKSSHITNKYHHFRYPSFSVLDFL